MEKTLFSPREEHLVVGKKSLFSKDSTKNERSCFILKHVLYHKTYTQGWGVSISRLGVYFMA